MSAAPYLQVAGIDVYYGASQILFGVDLAVEKGATMALLGRNGAGKSTTFKAIAGLARPRRGAVRIKGAEVQGWRAYRIARAGIGFVPEDRQIFPEHTVEENLELGAKPGPAGVSYWTMPRIWEVFPLLERLKRRYGGRLSGGEQQLLTIARSLMGNPDVLLLDEPSEGLAPIIVEQIAALVLRLRSMGVTMLLAEQNMHFCLGVATHVTVIDKGQTVYRDTIAGFAANDDVKRRYLAV